MKKILLFLCFFIFLQLIRVYGAISIINKQDKMSECYKNPTIINSYPYMDYSNKSSNYKKEKLKDINIFICSGFSSFRTMIMITDNRKNIIYFERDLYFDQNSNFYDYAHLGVYDDYVEYGYKIKIPLKPSLIDRIDGKIIQFLARFLALLEQS